MKLGKEVNEQAVVRILNDETTISKTAEKLEVHYTTFLQPVWLGSTNEYNCY